MQIPNADTVHKLPRIFCDVTLAGDTEADLPDAAAHHLRAVLRKSEGDCVRLFNGRDGEWLGELVLLTKKAATARPVTCLKPQRPEPGPRILFAPIKKQRMDVLIEKAVELGGARLSPVITQRTENRNLKADRLLAQVIGAAEQCERLTVPILDEPQNLDAVLEQWGGESPLIFLAEKGPGRPLLELATEVGRADVGLVIGPEGGFTENELESLDALASSHAATLGPRILRAETAALAALAIWQASAGDGGRAPRQEMKD
ncbi:MAG: 16S rRNA (uracil(1498)-N(3))-methyltransferase [Magnetovibrionaceae bacterium]